MEIPKLCWRSENGTVEIKKFRNQISIGLKYNKCTFLVHGGHCYSLEGVWSVFDLVSMQIFLPLIISMHLLFCHNYFLW